MPAQEYIADEKYDLIFLFGLIQYMNNEEIRKLSRNCKRMLKREGKLVMRNVIIKGDTDGRKVYSNKFDIFRILTRRMPYQTIKRGSKREIELFKEFDLVYSQMIEGTDLSAKIFKKKLDI